MICASLREPLRRQRAELDSVRRQAGGLCTSARSAPLPTAHSAPSAPALSSTLFCICSCSAHAQHMLSTCSAHAWHMLGTCLAHAWHARRTLCIVEGRPFSYLLRLNPYAAGRNVSSYCGNLVFLLLGR